MSQPNATIENATATISRGRFVWYELLAKDQKAATAYYTELIGWGTEIFEGGDQEYTMFTGGNGPLGGVMQLPDEAQKEGAPPHWIGYVDSPDIDATAARAAKLGARILVPPTEIPGAGRFTVISDPQGAVFALYSSDAHAPSPDRPPQVQEFSWHELATTDPDAAWDFYSDLFGWQKGEGMDMGEMGIYQIYHARGSEIPLGGIFKTPLEMAGSSAWLLYVRVPDAKESAEKVKELGGQILNGPMEVPGGDFIVQCLDPQGAAFALHSTAQG